MKYSSFFLIVSFILFGCGNDKVPDVSHIKINSEVKRFDKAFFSMDTTHLENSLSQLNQVYPDFFPDFVVKILGINPADPQALIAISAFIRSYKPVYAMAAAMADEELPETQKQLEHGLQLMKNYFPNWKPDSPFVITTFVGPMDVFEPFTTGDYGDVRTRTGVGIALQLHLGGQASVYAIGRQGGLFNDYQIRRFSPATMVVNSMKNVIDDAYPYTSSGKPLIEEMIEKGKRLYVLDKVLPFTDDTLKIGYTADQLKGCYENEPFIWDYFVKNDLLYNKESSINQLYIKDGPKTQELGDASPGYIGLFVGRQVVRAFMKKHNEMTLDALMKKEPNEILKESGYKP